jgi:hypothetical protein
MLHWSALECSIIQPAQLPAPRVAQLLSRQKVLRHENVQDFTRKCPEPSDDHPTTQATVHGPESPHRRWRTSWHRCVERTVHTTGQNIRLLTSRLRSAEASPRTLKSIQPPVWPPERASPWSLWFATGAGTGSLWGLGHLQFPNSAQRSEQA